MEAKLVLSDVLAASRKLLTHNNNLGAELEQERAAKLGLQDHADALEKELASQHAALTLHVEQLQRDLLAKDAALADTTAAPRGRRQTLGCVPNQSLICESSLAARTYVFCVHVMLPRSTWAVSVCLA